MLLHGLFGRGADWDPVLAAMGARGPCGPTSAAWAPDLPGHGTAPLGVAPLSLDGWADWVADGIAARWDRPVALVGYSLGGRVALRLALARPELVARLALIGANPGIDGDAKRAARARVDAQRAESIRNDLSAFLRRWYAAPLFGLSGAALEAAVAERATCDPGAVASVIEALSPGVAPSRWTSLAQLRVPVLAVAGEHDATYRAVSSAIVRTVGADGRFVVVPNAGHGVLRDAPEALSDVLTEWLSGDVAPTG